MAGTILVCTNCLKRTMIPVSTNEVILSGLYRRKGKESSYLDEISKCCSQPDLILESDFASNGVPIFKKARELKTEIMYISKGAFVRKKILALL